ncbi:MAG: hypothetical protein ACUVQZ_08150 [Candidatus Caldatribacteriaceae bacterium]
MSSLLPFEKDFIPRDRIRAVTPVLSTVSGHYHFFFLVQTKERTYCYFYQTEEEAHRAYEEFMRLLGNHS